MRGAGRSFAAVAPSVLSSPRRVITPAGFFQAEGVAHAPMRDSPAGSMKISWRSRRNRRGLEYTNTTGTTEAGGPFKRIGACPSNQSGRPLRLFGDSPATPIQRPGGGPVNFTRLHTTSPSVSFRWHAHRRDSSDGSRGDVPTSRGCLSRWPKAVPTNRPFALPKPENSNLCCPTLPSWIPATSLRLSDRQGIPLSAAKPARTAAA